MIVENKIGNRELFIIAGCSKLGSNIAFMLSKHKKYVVVIDDDPSAFKKLTPDYSGYTVTGDASDIGTLERAGIENSCVLIAATGSDNINVMASQIARIVFDVPNVFVRLYSEDLDPVATLNGINAIYPYKLSIETIEYMLDERGCLK
ncbi:MAG: TrkA family potassium uptake protein [Sedimentibacter sp.]|uniref:potassium channel family protein n=1 Tax=Sedimentibacter sp. TaxID=1960295 RepID=UPI00315916FD